MSQSGAGAIVIQGARVFDGEAFLEGTPDVVIEGGVITAVGAGAASRLHTGSGTVADGVEVVDATGHTLTPGFIDAHVHLMVQNIGGLDTILKPFSLPFYESVGYMERTLRAGITTARDAGGADLGLKTAQATGLVAGPRLRISVNIIGQTGGHGDHMLPSGLEMPLFGPHPGIPSGVADGPDEVRKATRMMFRAGADQIKICTTGGVLSPTDDPRHSQMTLDEIRAVVAEAEAQESYVLAHAQGAAGIRNAILGGVRSIEHGIYLDDETIQLMLDHDVALVPTLVAPLSVLRTSESGRTMNERVLAKAVAVVEIHKAAISRAVSAGVRVVFGTDTGVGTHGENLAEFALLAECGMSLEGVLTAATSASAQLVAPDLKLGRVAQEHVADLVLLDRELTSTADLTDIDQAVTAVFQDGARVL
ncbi:metal-dependent hydrolase family protein [Ornithinimicrobium cavernae]|uniref:metal-dependent hydrolase family protein n=1 Tax=Ornithinimicrobium cavernae TaxID=2666047 RepID=UPI000D69ABDD|nr:amidohydrolase family protein [Ornithinimicrobium cavernae]